MLASWANVLRHLSFHNILIHKNTLLLTDPIKTEKYFMCTIILGSETFFSMKFMAIHLNVKREMRSKTRFPNFAPTV